MEDPISGAGPDAIPSDTLRFGYSGAQRVVLRSLLWGMAFIVFCAGIAGLSAPDVAVGAPLAVVSFGVAAGVAWFTEARVRVSVEARSDALVVRNSLRTHVIPWDDIAGFARAKATALKDVRLTDGRRIKMQGLPPGWFGSRDPQRQGLEQLEAYRVRAMAHRAEIPPRREIAGER